MGMSIMGLRFYIPCRCFITTLVDALLLLERW
jgi:hypothetical protein